MFQKIVLINIFTLLISFFSYSQNIEIEGYVFEENNRGYLNEAKINIYDDANNELVNTVTTNIDGQFKVTLTNNHIYRLITEKNLFFPKKDTINTINSTEKHFIKIQMTRKPGYIFDVTLAEKKTNISQVVDAIEGARIEIYNNTKKKEELVIESNSSPFFNYTFERGNNYTVLIRKKGFYNKRMEAHIDIDGCILCFEGLGSINPGVSDNVSSGFESGTMLANVELERIDTTKTFELKNIYYDYDKYDLRAASKLELDKVINMLKGNPSLIVELGSHTDSRGNDLYNMTLSENRAKACVEYIKEKGNIKNENIRAKGYGETILVNNCKNGVTCNETEHQKNRRTELKVVGFGLDPYEGKSLEDIIREEQIDATIEELSSTDGYIEELSIKEGEELPEEIKRDLERAASREKEGNTTISYNTEPIIVKNETNTPIDTITIIDGVEYKGNVLPTLPTTSSSIQEVAKKENKVEQVDNIINTNNNLTKDSLKTQPLKKEIVKPIPGRDYAILMPKNYNGYKIQLVATTKILTGESSIYKLGKDIYIEKRENNINAYLLGDFDKLTDAINFMDTNVIKKYPHAFVVKYANGIRVK